jgi:hypothetical protein
MDISKENRNMDNVAVKDAIDNRVGGIKAAVKEALDKTDPEFAKAFGNLTPEQKAFGLLQGKLMKQKIGNHDVEEAFSWYASEYAGEEWYKPLDLRMKVWVLQHMLSVLDGISEKTYRAVRKIYVTAAQGD